LQAWRGEIPANIGHRVVPNFDNFAVRADLCTRRIRRRRRLRNTRFPAARYYLTGPVFHRQERVSFA